MSRPIDSAFDLIEMVHVEIIAGTSIIKLVELQKCAAYRKLVIILWHFCLSLVDIIFSRRKQLDPPYEDFIAFPARVEQERIHVVSVGKV